MRKVLGVYGSPQPDRVGEGIPVRSLFSQASYREHVSPFLLLDYAGPTELAPADKPRGVDVHPHRGFETVTIVYRGEVEHRDSTGQGGLIGPGDVQWMTAASDILHQEFQSHAFTKKGGTLETVQLWVNLPAKSDYSRIINARAVDRLASLIEPTKVIAGGKSDPEAHYLDPTLLYPITWDDKIMADEIFGPILPILTYKSFDEAMARMAATPRALAGVIFSRDQKTIDRFIGELSYGGGGVNLVNVHLFVETMPFGGTGSAGMGHYYGKYGFDALTHAKSMLISPPDVAINHLYSPFTDEKNRALQGWFEY